MESSQLSTSTKLTSYPSWRALLANFSLSRGRVRSSKSVPGFARELLIRESHQLGKVDQAITTLARRSLVALRVVRSRLLRTAHRPDPRLLVSPELRKIAAAWTSRRDHQPVRQVQKSPDYSIDLEGVVFPGERPWEARWSYLESAADYRNRRVLELGCNLGLLSTWALTHGGASAALGVDHDPDIVRAAGLVAEAFGVRPEFRVVDFDHDSDLGDTAARIRSRRGHRAERRPLARGS